MSHAWRGGSTRAHRRARVIVLTRDGHLCRLRLTGCTILATEAHHTLGKTVTGDDPNFMIAACKHCNLKVGDPRATQRDPAPRPRTIW